MHLRNRREGWLLFLLLLSGCAETESWFALGMVCAPLCYAVAAALLVGLSKLWSFRPPQPKRRLPVLLVPALILGASALVLYSTLHPVVRMKLHARIADQTWLFVSILTSVTLVGLFGLIWRAWFSVAPESSVEGSAALGAAIFYGPGMLMGLQLAGREHTVDTLFVLFVGVTLWGSAPSLCIGSLLVLEALVRRHLLR